MLGDKCSCSCLRSEGARGEYCYAFLLSLVEASGASERIEESHSGLAAALITLSVVGCAFVG